MKTKSATITQLMKLKLNVQKSNCSNYLKIFERFDRKKQKSLEDLREDDKCILVISENLFTPSLLSKK